MKSLAFIQRNNQRHWVGDGFPVRSIFSYTELAAEMSPFLLLDYAGPADFPPTEERRGVGAHPHRGFETVTIVYAGEVEHRDSSGGGGRIGPGDVQWMTAGSGVVHEEFHGAEYARRGGPFEMIQLWVNLPQKDKMTAPRYQSISNEDIPRIPLAGGAGSVRVVAGAYDQTAGPARTFTPVNLWDVRLKASAEAEFLLPAGHTAALFVLGGYLRLSSGEQINGAELAVLERDGDRFAIQAHEDVTALILSGQPLGEPVVGYGPFVMTTRAEIQQAFNDYNSGRFNQLPPVEGGTNGG